MKDKRTSLISWWMLSPPEIIAIVAVVVLTVGGLLVSIQDALQLERAINLNLTQSVVIDQGIVNLQREVNLTRIEVLRLLGNMDNPPKPITRFDFIKIQV